MITPSAIAAAASAGATGPSSPMAQAMLEASSRRASLAMTAPRTLSFSASSSPGSPRPSASTRSGVPGWSTASLR